MNPHGISRRQALARSFIALGSAVATGNLSAQAPANSKPGRTANQPFLFCLNTATIRGQKLGIVKEIEVVAEAGYDGIEPWISSIEEYVKAGGKLTDLRKRIADLGITVESAIGFPEWVVDDDARRAKGLERAKYEMDLVAQIGGKRIAAPPAGATNTADLDPIKAAGRYRALLEAGEQIGIIPQLELWGFSKALGRLSECVAVAVESGRPEACVLTDVFHLYKSGSDHHGLALLNSSAAPVMHLNDYPADPPREKVDDSMRTFPGDGVAPLIDILRLLNRAGGQRVLSLEVFNREYWKQDPLLVARTGLEKMKRVVQVSQK